MKRTVRFAVAILSSLMAFVMTACGSSTTATSQQASPPTSATPSASSTVDRSKTITINGRQTTEQGKPYTCGVVIGAENDVCSDPWQKLFNKWGDNIPAYVDSGKLGPLGNDTSDTAVMRYEDIAASGLSACSLIAAEGLSTDNANKFVEWMLKSYPNQERVAFLPFYFEASKSLCPDAVGHRSDGDVVTP